jgi:hypothetical protein
MATLNQLKKLAKKTQPLTWKGPIEQQRQASDQQQKNFLGRFALAIDDYHSAERKLKTLKDDGTPDERGITKTDRAKYDAASKKTSIADMWEERYGDLYNPQRDGIIKRSLKLANLRSRLQSERHLKATADRVRHINILQNSIKRLNNANNADIKKLNRRFVEVHVNIVIQTQQGDNPIHPWHFTYGTKITSDEPSVKNHAVKKLLDAFDDMLRSYTRAADLGNGAQLISSILDGTVNPKKNIHIVYQEDYLEDPPYAKYPYIWSYEPVFKSSINGTGVIVANRDQAPNVYGLTNVATGDYGCVISTLSYVTNTPQHEIYKRFCDIVGTEAYEITDETPEDELDYFVQDLEGSAGYSPQQLADYLTKHCKNLRWYIHVNYVTDIIGPDIKRKTHNYKTQHFTFLNDHIYLGKLEYGRIDAKGKEPWVLEADDDYKDILGTQSIVYVKGLEQGKSLNNLVIQMIKDGKQPQIEPGPTGIKKIMLENTVFVEYDDYNERREFVQRMTEIYPHHHEFRRGFNDQPWSRIATAEMEAAGVHLPESFDNLDARRVIKMFTTAPFTGAINSPTGAPLHHIDIKSAYLQWCISHEDANIGVFHAVDDFVCLSTAQTHTYGNFEQTQQIPDLPLRAKVADMILDNAVGEVLLDDFSVHGYHIKRMIWPSYTVKLLLNKNWIQSRHIVAWRQASQSCPVTLLSNYMKKMVIEAGDNYKTVYTRLFGMLGLSEQQSFEGFLTTSDEQCAQALRSHAGYQRKIIDEENQIYMLYKIETEQKLENFNPFFRFVASGSIFLLLELVDRMMTIDPTWRIISSRTDNVYFEGSEFHFDTLDNYLQSEWGFEYGDLEWKSFPLAKWEDPKPHTIVTENHEPRMEDISPPGGYQGTLKTGVAGCGKSRDMRKQLQSIIAEGHQQKQKVLMIAPTHKVRIAMEDVKKLLENPIVTQGDAVIPGAANNEAVKIKNNHVSIKIVIFAQLDVLYAKGNLANKFDHIFVDEFSMMGSTEYKLLCVLVNNNPAVELTVYGEQAQLPGIGRVWLDTDSPGFHTLLPRRVQMPYKFEGPNEGRMSQRQYDAIMELLNTGKLPESLLARVRPESDIKEFYEHNIAFTNKKCVKVGKPIIESAQIDKPWYVCVNLPKLKIFNGTTITDADKILYNLIEGEQVIPNTCLTYYRSQGQTFNKPGCIYQSDHKFATLNHLYVALSRWRDLDQFWIVGNIDKLREKTWEPFVYTRELSKDESQNPDQFGTLPYTVDLEPIWEGNVPQHFVIYYITDDVMKVNYIGQTACKGSTEADEIAAMEKRLKEHQRSPLNKDLISDAAKIQLVVRLDSVKGHKKLLMIEKYWTQKYKNIDGYKTINRLNIEEEKPVIKPAPAMHVDLKQLQMSTVNYKNPKELRWQAGKGLKNITQKRTANDEYDRAEHTRKINEWLMTEGIKIDRIKKKMEALKMI